MTRPPVPTAAPLDVNPPEPAAHLTGWFRELSDAMAPLDAMGAASLIVEPRSGRVLGATGATQRVFGGTSASDLADLIDLGLIARPDLDRLRGWVRDRRRTDLRDRPEVETSHSLTDRLRVHLPDQEPMPVEISLVYHRRPRLGAEAVTVSLRPLATDELAGTGHQRPLPREVWTLYDHELRVVATDPRLVDLGIDPLSQIGMPAATLTHPEDLPEVLGPAVDVLQGRTRSAEIRIRAAVAGGRWQQAVVELRRLVTDDAFFVLGIVRFERTGRQPIPTGLLSRRQAVVVTALFDGLRVKDIAAAEHVSERTVRNQLAAAYRKLHVAGQADLLSTYLRPSGT